MTDLFTSMEVHQAVRLAIMQESSVPDAVIHAEEDRHRCEVDSVIRQYYPDNKRAAAYFDLVEKARGKEAADRLRADCRIAWAKRREEVNA